MKKKIFKSALGIAMGVFAVSTFCATIAVPTQAASMNFGSNYAANTGLSDQDPRQTIANIINVILGFLAVLAVAIILYGGFKWMTAAGNEDQVGEAKKIIVSGIIGLVIILAAWGIANFALKAINNSV